MSAAPRLLLKVHKAIAEKAGGDLVGYSVYRALRLEATQVSPLLVAPKSLTAEVFATMHAEDKHRAAARVLFHKALDARQRLRDDYNLSVEIKTRGVTLAPIVTAIILWDTDPLNKTRITL